MTPEIPNPLGLPDPLGITDHTEGLKYIITIEKGKLTHIDEILPNQNGRTRRINRGTIDWDALRSVIRVDM